MNTFDSVWKSRSFAFGHRSSSRSWVVNNVSSAVYSTAVGAFDKSNQWYWEEKKYNPLPQYINGTPQNVNKQGLIECSWDFLQMYFMFSFHLACVLIIMTVIGLINASQERRSPCLTFYFRAKDVCGKKKKKGVWQVRPWKLHLLRGKKTHFLLQTSHRASGKLCLISYRLGWAGMLQVHGKRIHGGFFHPSCITTSVSVCTGSLRMRGGAQISRILFHVWRSVCHSEIHSWKLKMPELLGAVLPYMFQAWNRLCEEIQDWPGLHTVLFSRKSFSPLCIAGMSFCFASRSHFGRVDSCFRKPSDSINALLLGMLGETWKRHWMVGHMEGHREGGGIGLSVVMFCVRQNFCCLCLMCLFSLKRQLSKLHSGYRAENHYSRLKPFFDQRLPPHLQNQAFETFETSS